MRALRRWLLLTFILIAASADAQVGPLLKTGYTPPKTRGSAGFFLQDIAARTGIVLSYSDELVKRQRTIRLDGKEHSVEETLQIILAGTRLVAVERNGKILLVPATDKAAEQQNVTLSGFVRDRESREVLIGAVVFLPESGTGTTTNTFGYYSLTVPAGKWTVVTSSFGYTADTSAIQVVEDTRRDLLLPYRLNLTGVTVSAQKASLPDHVHLTGKEIMTHAGLLGENDVLRSLQYVPGVQMGGEGSSTILVRGGDPGQNLTLLDGVPLYYIDHFYGITSIFNTEAVKSVDFYKGAFPSRYGGRLSSVIDVSSRDGNMERISGQASLGLLKGSLTLESPIVKDKASVMLSARRTWIDALWRPAFDELGVDFYDINAKANWIVNKNNRVYGAFYTGRDQFRLEFENEKILALWGNTIGSLRWTSVINPKLFISTTATYSYFRFQLRGTDPSTIPDSLVYQADLTGKSEIFEAALRLQADYYASSKHRVQFGLQYATAKFLPASVSNSQDNSVIASPEFRSHEIIAHAEDEWKLSRTLTARAGLHLATWISETYQYFSPQPRLYLAWRPASSRQFYLTATRMSQFLHMVGSNTTFAPTDFWLPSTRNLAPEQSWLFAGGVSQKIKKNVELSAEVYYKDITNLAGYKAGASVFQNSEKWEDQLTSGNGYGYGLETSARGKWGPLSTSLAYTLAWAWRQSDLMNDGKPFPARYDRRHNLHTELMYEKPGRFSAIVNWTYMSGEALTLPDQAYPDFDNNVNGPTVGGPRFTYNYTERNNYRLPPIHRLDFSLNFIKRRGRYFERTWTLGLFNAYANKNIIGVYLNEDEPGRFTLRGISLFRCIPTISYSIKF